MELLVDSLLPTLETALPIWLCLLPLPHRGRFGVRTALCAVLMLALTTLVASPGWSPLGSARTLGELSQLVSFAILFTAYVLLGRLVCSISTWTSIFCCAIGYTAQNLGSSLGMLVWRALQAVGGPAAAVPATLAITLVLAATIAICELALFRRLGGLERETENDHSLLVVFWAVIVLVIGMSVLVSYFEREAPYGSVPVLALRAFHAIVCALVLLVEWEYAVNRRLRSDAAVSRRLAEEQVRQMELSQQTIEAINVKCHDMRHQIRALARQGGIVDASVIDDMERQIRVYDSSVRTGNEALDTVLTEKGLICEQQAITLSVIADGTSIDFLPATDIYSLFGNALENAIEAVLELDDPSLRAISLNVHSHEDLTSISVENYYDGPLALSNETGLPTSQRGAGHGFGMRSMELTCEHWGGTLSVSAEDGVFRLCALLPHPQG